MSLRRVGFSGVLVVFLRVAVAAAASPRMPEEPAQASEAAITKAAPASESRDARWYVTAAGGPAASRVSRGGEGAFVLQPAWQIEVQRQRPGESLYGLAIDAGPDDRHLLGVAAIAGSAGRWARLTLEGSGGVGFESIRAWATSTTVATERGSSTTTIVGGTEVALYARGTLAVGYAVSPSWDVLVRLGAHLGAGRFPQTSFTSSTLGLRFRLP
jgi:hypothetical protein